MKDAIKLSGILVIGLLTAIIIYPVLHESGHSVAAILFGADVVEFNLFPLPNVLCNMGSVNKIGIVITGIGGMIMPLFISVVIPVKRFWLWYTALILKGISLFSLIISTVAIILYQLGTPMINEDITQVLNIWNDGWIACLIISVLLSALIVISIIRRKPLQRLFKYFEINNAAKQMTASA